MKKQSIFLLIIGLLSLTTSAQRKIQQLDEEEAKKQEQLKPKSVDKKGFDKEKMVYGGNVGASFANGNTFILAQPMVGYKVKPKTVLGTGFTYIYQSIKYLNTNYTSTAWGPILFARQNLLPQIFAHAEYQPINHEVYITPTKFERVWTQNAFIGGGLGGDGAQVYVLYNLLHDANNSYYESPWYIRIGFMF